MKTQVVKATLLTSLIWTAISCQSDRTSTGVSPALAPAGATQGPAAQGTSSGGGDFRNQGARDLLRRASQGLAGEIRRASPRIFRELPQGMTQESLAKLIEDVRFDENQTARRHGELLGFDYRQDRSGKYYLVATKSVFDELASVNVNTINPQAMEERLLDIKIRLAHEAAHVIGIGRSQQTDMLARGFGAQLNLALANDMVVCTLPYSQSSPDWSGRYQLDQEMPTDKAEEVRTRSFVWIFNRTNGKGTFVSPLHGLVDAPRYQNSYQNIPSFVSYEEAIGRFLDPSFVNGEVFMSRIDRANFGLLFPSFSPSSQYRGNNLVRDWPEGRLVQNGNVVLSSTADVGDLSPEGKETTIIYSEVLTLELGNNLRGKATLNFTAVTSTEGSPSNTKQGTMSLECASSTENNDLYLSALQNPNSEIGRIARNATLTQINQIIQQILAY